MLKQSFLLLVLCITAAACSQSDAQREFEREAQAPPENITEMTPGGQPVENGATDPEDWRSSPMYRGLVDIETPAYPNPVNLNTPLRIEINNKGIETLSGIEVYVFQFDITTDIAGPLYTAEQSSIFPGIITIQLDPNQFARRSTGNTGIFRILIYDGRQNLISYGDVRVQ